MCHRVSEATAWQCNCGYEFGQRTEVTVQLLRAQRKRTRAQLGVLLALDVGAIFGVVYAAFHGFVVFSVLGFALLTTWTLRAVSRLSVTRTSLRLLEQAPLPEARARKPKD